MSKSFYGKAYNSRGKYKAKTNNSSTLVYRIWQSMVQRCYSPIYQEKYPTYIGCMVADEWLDFQDFAEWFENQYYSGLGYHLDKDLLFPNNKLYSPETCCFIPSELNNLLISCTASRGDYPQGVSFDKSKGKYKAELNINGKKKNLGRFTCPNEAHRVYKKAKEAHVKTKALEWQDRIARDVFDALMSWELV